MSESLLFSVEHFHDLNSIILIFTPRGLFHICGVFSHVCMYVCLCSLIELDVSHNQLTYVPSGLFLLPELSSLLLSYNLLTHLPGDPDDATAQASSGES